MNLPNEKDDEIRIAGRAKFDFAAKTEKEYALKKGQSIVVTKRIDDNWCMVENVSGSKSGMVPIAYIEVIQSSASRKPNKSGIGVAKFDYAADSSKELSFEKEDEITLIEKVDENWYKGRLYNKNGLVPSLYIEVLAEPEREPKADTTLVLPERKDSASTDHSPSPSMASLATTMTTASQDDEEPGEKERKQRAAFLANSVVGSTLPLHTKKRALRKEDLIDQIEKEELARLEKKENNPSSWSPRRYNGTETSSTGKQTVKYVILYSYEAGNEDELDLVAGDIVNVVETCEDGWFVGSCERTGAFGTFPGNYAKLPEAENGNS